MGESEPRLEGIKAAQIKMFQVHQSLEGLDKVLRPVGFLSQECGSQLFATSLTQSQYESVHASQ